MISLLFLLREVFQKRRDTLKYSPEEFNDASLKTIALAEVAFSTLTGGPPDLDPLMSVMGNSHRVEYVGDLQHTWTEIRPSLDRYKRGGILAPG
jgi:hypothetical protein